MHPLRIGFIGMGLMGVPMSLRLRRAGFSISVWNRSPDKSEPLKEHGVRVCEHLHELISDSDILMICVTDTGAVRAIVEGPGGVAEHGRDSQVLIDFSSIDPQATREMAEALKMKTGIQERF